MKDFMARYFGPLTKGTCVYFLFLSMLFFFALIFTIIGEVIFLVKNYKTINYRVFVSGVLLLFNSFIAYFANRLLYTMCTENYLK